MEFIKINVIDEDDKKIPAYLRKDQIISYYPANETQTTMRLIQSDDVLTLDHTFNEVHEIMTGRLFI